MYICYENPLELFPALSMHLPANFVHPHSFESALEHIPLPNMYFHDTFSMEISLEAHYSSSLFFICISLHFFKSLLRSTGAFVSYCWYPCPCYILNWKLLQPIRGLCNFLYAFPVHVLDGILFWFPFQYFSFYHKHIIFSLYVFPALYMHAHVHVFHGNPFISSLEVFIAFYMHIFIHACIKICSESH